MTGMKLRFVALTSTDARVDAMARSMAAAQAGADRRVERDDDMIATASAVR